MSETWSNWSGSLTFEPQQMEQPEDESSLIQIVQRAAEQGRKLRVVGAGHSSSPLVQTEDVLVSLNKFQGLITHNLDTCQAVLRTGMTIEDMGRDLQKIGLAMPNTGDVDVQTITGAIGTGTHGTGKRLQNLSTLLVGVRMVNGRGEINEYSIENEPDALRALRVSLGSAGIFTEIRLQLVPAFQLHRQEWCTHIDDCLNHLDALMAQNRNFDFYWYPRSDEAKLRTLNVPGEEPDTPPYAKLVKENTGWSNEVLPRQRVLKFDEMEYALPAEAGVACFQEVRQRIKAKWRRIVGWRLLYRTIAQDDTYLSPYYQRESVTISLHQNAGLPYEEYFADIEPVFRAYGGRPHWGKKHHLKAADLRPLYPMWEQFQSFRRRCDPDGRFLTPYLQELLGA
jgi:FAD/FMN-containing dehydrogenase